MVFHAKQKRGYWFIVKLMINDLRIFSLLHDFYLSKNSCCILVGFYAEWLLVFLVHLQG
jgi:hypothetical protein